MNRYTRLSTSQYNPLSLQEMMIAPAYLREQHDKSEAAIAGYETELAKIDALDVHNEVALNRQKELYNELSGYSDELASNGFSNFNKSNLIKFNKKFQNEISPTGIIGKANAAKKQFDIEKANYIANATKMGYSPEAAGANWQKHAEAYTNAFDGKNITNIDSLYAPEYINAIDKATELFKSAGLTEKDIVNLGKSGIVTKDPRGVYVITRKGRDYVGSNEKQLQAAVDYINNQIKNPSSTVHKSLVHQGKNPENVLSEIAGLSAVYLKNKTIDSDGSTISNFTPVKPTKVETIPFGGEVPHESMEASSVKNAYSNIGNVLNKINNGETHSKLRYPIDPKDTPYNKEMLRRENAKSGKPYNINDLDEKDLNIYKKLYDRVKNVYSELKDIQFDDPKAIKYVSDIINQNQNILRQDIIITGDIVKEYGNSSVGVKASDPSKMDELLYREKNYRKYFIDGKVVSYDDLPSDIKKNFNNMKYSGYKSPKNYDTFIYGKENNKNLFVSPLVYNYTNEKGDNKQILVSRSAMERKSNSYKADALFNDIFTNTNLVANIPYKIPGQNNYISYNPDTKLYTINTKNIDGEWLEPKYLDENQLHSKLYDAFNVKYRK